MKIDPVDHTTQKKAVEQSTGTTEKKIVQKKPITQPVFKEGIGSITGNSIPMENKEKSKVSSSSLSWRSVIDIATDIIIRHEGKLHLCAFKDNTRWSIGYGTKSYAWECITEEEALRRFKEAVQWRVDAVIARFPDLWNHQQAAIVSLYYNCNSCYLNLWKNITAGSFRRYATENKFPWLVKRAKNERALFSLWVMY